VTAPPRDGRAPQRWVRVFAATRSGASLLARLMPPLDRMAFRLTGHRRTLTAVATGLPVVVLTATGARTGAPRTVPLLGFPIMEGLAVVAGNFGRPWDPAWCVNLRANPRATVQDGDTVRTVVAHELAGAARESAWRQCLSMYPGGAAYADRAAPRVIAVFLLEPSP
jgi:deazaflavin-dependent oxidoreductase (nitroreductase family)